MHEVHRMTKVTLLSLAMLGVMSNAAIVTSLPHLGEHFEHIHNIELLSRLMITLPSLVIALFAPFLGHFIHRTSVIKNALFALGLFALAGSAGLYLQDIYALLASRMVLGVAIAIIMIVGTTLVGSYFSGESRHQFMGMQSAFISIGGILFITGGGLLSDIGWRYPFVIYLIGFAVLPLAALFLHEPKTLPHDAQDEAISGNLWFVYGLAFLLMIVFYTLPTQMPFLMINHFGASGTLTGLIISSAMASNALGALSFARMKKQMGFGSIYLLGLVVLALGFVAIGNISNVYLFFITSPMMGFGGGLLMTTTTAWMLHSAHHSKHTRASGYLTGALFGGQFVSPLLFHPFVAYFGLQQFFVLLGVVVLTGVVIVKLYLSLKLNGHFVK
jgi:MFS family permease